MVPEVPIATGTCKLVRFLWQMEEELRELQVQRDAAQARLDEVSRKLEAEEEAKQKAEEAAKKLAEEAVFRQVHSLDAISLLIASSQEGCSYLQQMATSW